MIKTEIHHKLYYMAEKTTVLSLANIISQNKEIVDSFLSENITVICINKSTNAQKSISFKVMFENNKEFWLLNKTWEYYIEKDAYEKLLELIASPDTVQRGTYDQGEGEAAPKESDESDADNGFGDEYDAIAAMEDFERAKKIMEGSVILESLIEKKPKEEKEVTEALVSTVKITMLHNHAALLNTLTLTSEEAKKQTQDIVDSTKEFVKSSSLLISENIFNDDLMNTLVSESNGTIIQHMIRTYLNGLAFLSYYNKAVTSSSLITRLRVSFDEKHRDFYHQLLPHLDREDITLERVFMGGMRAISEDDFLKWATGFLIHDLGKAAAVEYHEGEEAYNRDIVVEHIKIGYDSVMNKTNYPRESGLITGYHHEYYGNPSGYGYFRSYLEQYKKANPNAEQNYFITLDLKPVIDCEALAYFPAKVLEIIDVFDSVTDPARKYRKAMTPVEALKMMEEEFIIKEPKIDLILFEIFSKFINEMPANKAA